LGLKGEQLIVRGKLRGKSPGILGSRNSSDEHYNDNCCGHGKYDWLVITYFLCVKLGNRGNIMEVRVTNPKVVGKAIKEINFPEKSLMVMIQRGSESLIAHSNLKLEYNDIATIIAEKSSGKHVSDILFR